MTRETIKKAEEIIKNKTAEWYVNTFFDKKDKVLTYHSPHGLIGIE